MPHRGGVPHRLRGRCRRLMYAVYHVRLARALLVPRWLIHVFAKDYVARDKLCSGTCQRRKLLDFNIANVLGLSLGPKTFVVTIDAWC